MKVFFRRDFAPVYAAGLAYALVYGNLGATREWAPSGLAKVTYMREYQDTLTEDERNAQESILSRMSNFNQLSQIGRVVHEDGFYEGGTLGYLTFALIPRFLWREKPPIQRGAWFAQRIGQGRMREDGWYTNTINMTQAGELYLNFGWLGAALGLMLCGVFFGVLWMTATTSDAENTLGWAWAYFLTWHSLGQNGDLLVLITLLAIYLVMLALSVSVRLLRSLVHRRRAESMPHLITFLYQPRRHRESVNGNGHGGGEHGAIEQVAPTSESLRAS